MFHTWSVRVCVQNFAIVRHGVSEEIGHRQYKQTLKYLVDKPFDAHCCRMSTATEHPVPDRVQPWASECPDVKNYKWQLNPIWHKMLNCCTHKTTVGVKGPALTRNFAIIVCVCHIVVVHSSLERRGTKLILALVNGEVIFRSEG